MTAFVMPCFDGMTVEQIEQTGLLEDGYVSLEDIESYLAMKAAVLEDMMEAGEEGDLERVEYLDGIYQELLDLLRDISAQWPGDFLHSSFQECQFR